MSRNMKAYWAQWDSIVLKDGTLKRALQSEDVKLPKEQLSEELKLLHNTMSGGLRGVRKTLEKVRELFYWANCIDDVKD